MRKKGETGAEESSESSPTGGELTHPSRQSNSRGKRSSKGAPTRRPGGIRVLVMSDHALTREALCLLIRGQPGIRIVGEAQNDPNDLAAAREKPDVILIDLDSSRHDGFDFLSKITKKARGARLIVLTGAPPSEVYPVVRLGVMGVVSKEKPASFLLQAIEQVNFGEVWLDRSLMSLALREVLSTNNADGDRQQIAKLTKREREVVALVGAGRKNEQIAEHLSITVTTVRHHLTSIFNKLGVQGRFNLVFFAYENGLAFPPRIAPR